MTFVALALIPVGSQLTGVAGPTLERLIRASREKADLITLSEYDAKELSKEVANYVAKAVDWAGKSSVKGRVNRDVYSQPGTDLIEKICQTLRMYHQELRVQLNHKSNEELMALLLAYSAEFTTMSEYKKRIQEEMGEESCFALWLAKEHAPWVAGAAGNGAGVAGAASAASAGAAAAEFTASGSTGVTAFVSGASKTLGVAGGGLACVAGAFEIGIAINEFRNTGKGDVERNIDSVIEKCTNVSARVSEQKQKVAIEKIKRAAADIKDNIIAKHIAKNSIKVGTGGLGIASGALFIAAPFTLGVTLVPGLICAGVGVGASITSGVVFHIIEDGAERLEKLLKEAKDLGLD